MDYARFLFGFGGRLNRGPYLAAQLSLLALWLMIQFQLFGSLSQWESAEWLIVITLAWINVSTTAKRLHDRNRSGWWAVAVFAINRVSLLYYGLFLKLCFGGAISVSKELVLFLIAVVLWALQIWIAIELFFLAGTERTNRFGPDPMRTRPGSPASNPAATNVPDFLVHREASLLRG
jgi:uncharacterized membrane protein YhaH (DUF805 family)